MSIVRFIDTKSGRSSVIDIPPNVDEDWEAKLIVWRNPKVDLKTMIESFIKILHHNRVQAEQCATIVVNKGKCQVTRGSIELMEHYQLILKLKNIITSIV